MADTVEGPGVPPGLQDDRAAEEAKAAAATADEDDYLDSAGPPFEKRERCAASLEALGGILGKAPDATVSDAEIVLALLEDCAAPLPDKAAPLSFDEDVVLRVDGGQRVMLALEPETFLQLHYSLQALLVASLTDLLHTGGPTKSLFHAVRFRCFGQRREAAGGIVRVVLALLHHVQRDVQLSFRVIRLLGAVCAAGITAKDLKTVLRALRRPTPLAVPLIEALSTMASPEEKMVKASPPSFFNFGGAGSGLFVPPLAWPFSRGLALCTWFRAERFRALDGRGDARVHLFTFLDAQERGVDVYFDGPYLRVAIRDGGGGWSVLPPPPTPLDVAGKQARRGASMTAASTTPAHQQTFFPRVWYSICVSLSRPKLGLFGKETLSVYVDGQLFWEGPAQLPRAVGGAMEACAIGRDLDGQMAPVYVFKDAVSPQTLEALTAHGAKGGGGSWGSPPDLEPSAIGSSRYLTQRMLLAYHPSRCVGRVCLEVHGGHHAAMGAATQAWALNGARDVIGSIGGVPALFPLLAAFMDHKDASLAAWRQWREEALLAQGGGEGGGGREGHTGGVGGPRGEEGPSGGEGAPRGGTPNPTPTPTPTPTPNPNPNPMAPDDGPVSRVLGLLARFIRGHAVNQRDMVRVGGAELLEHALFQCPEELLRHEGEACVRALLELCAAAQGLPLLENELNRRLLFNLRLWSRASLRLQTALLPVLVGSVQSSPKRYRRVVGVEALLHVAAGCYPPEAAPSPPLTANERLHMRRAVLSMVRFLLSDASPLEDVRSLLAYLCGAPDAQRKAEAAQLLLGLLLQPRPPPLLFAGLLRAAQGPDSRTSGPRQQLEALVVHECLDDADEALRGLGLRLLTALQARAGAQLGSAAQDEGNALVRAWRSLQRRQGGDLGAYPLVLETLRRFGGAASEHSYAALMEMVLTAEEDAAEGVAGAGAEGHWARQRRPSRRVNLVVESLGPGLEGVRARSTMRPSAHPQFDSTTLLTPSTLALSGRMDAQLRVRDPLAAAVLFGLLPAMPEHLRATALEDLCRLAGASGDNCAALAQTHGWQLHLVEVIAGLVGAGGG